MSLPITQTDGLTYYGIAETFAETGDFFAEIPDYLSVKWEEGVYINEFLPVPTLYLAAFIKFFGEKVAFNGGAIGLLFVFSNLYLYLLASKFVPKKAALLVTLFGILNFRFYYLLWGGNWANVFAMLFSVPAIYYFWNFLEKNRNRDFGLMVLFLFFAAGSHTVHYLFTVFLMSGMWFGVKVFKNTKIKLPEIKLKFGDPDKNWLKVGNRTLAISIIVFFATFVPFALAGARTKWVTEWIDYLMQMNKVPEFWHWGIISDGPILIVLAVLGVIYAFYKQNWGLLGIAIPSYVMICLTKFLVPDEIWLSLFVYRYQAFHFIILGLLAVYFVFDFIKTHPKSKKLLITLLILSMTWQTAKTGALMYKIEPAITEDELAAAEYLKETGEEFWLINNVNTWSSFRSYEWILAYGDGNKNNLSFEVDEKALEAPYILVQDISALTNSEQIMLEKRGMIWDQGTVAIYKK
ncbi:MAG: hypothetical protein ABII07_05455 [Patescibacteria group bacterium]